MPITLSYDNDNSLASIGGYSVTNNPGGNITGMNGPCPTCYGTFLYDARGHLQESLTLVSGQWVTQDNSYDALGRRYGISQTTGSGTTPISYMYDGLNVVLAYNGSSSIASMLGLDLDESLPGEYRWVAEFSAQGCAGFHRGTDR